MRLEGDPGGAVGLLTFDPAQAGGQGLVASLNNLDSLKAVPANDGRSVPAASVRLVGEGRCQGVVKRCEAILHARDATGSLRHALRLGSRATAPL